MEEALSPFGKSNLRMWGVSGSSAPIAPTAPPSSNIVPLIGLVEKPAADKAPSRLGVFGRYLLEPVIWSAIAHTRVDAGGEVQLTDALNLLCENEPLFGFCFEGRHYEASDGIGYLKANIELSLRGSELRQFLLQQARSSQLELCR